MPKPNKYYKNSTRDRGIKNKIFYGKEKVDYLKFLKRRDKRWN